MRKYQVILIGLIALFCCASVGATSPAWVRFNGGLSESTATAAQTFTLTTSSTAGNSLVVQVTWNTTSRIVNYVCAGTSCGAHTVTCVFFPLTQQVTNGTHNASQLFVGTNCPGSVSSITVDFSGTTTADTFVNEYSGPIIIGQITSATGTSAHPLVSITIQDANNLVIAVFSSIGTAGVMTSDVGNLRAATRNGTSGTANSSGGACDNTSATAGTSVSCEATMTSQVWTAQAVEFRSNAPTETDHASSQGGNTPGVDQTATPTVFTGPMVPDPVLSGNTIMCTVSWPYLSSQTLTVKTQTTFGGSTVDTFTKDLEADDTSGNSLAVFRVAATAGTQYVQFTFGTAVASSNFTYSCSQMYNVQVSSPVDATCSATAQAGPTLSCGTWSSTPASTDLIYYATFNDAEPYGEGQGNGYCGAASGFTILIGHPTADYCTEFSTTSGSATPSVFFPVYNGNTSNAFNQIGVAYKTSSGQGTAPSGMYIKRQFVWYQLGTGIVYGNCPSTGNFMSGTMSQPSGTVTVNDSNQVSYAVNQPGGSATDGGGQLFYSSNSTLNASAACKYDHNETNGDEIVWRDVYGVASSPIDGLAGACPAPSSFGGAGNPSCYNVGTNTGGSQGHLPDIAPSSTTKTMVIATVTLGTGPISALTAPSGAILDCPYFSGMTDADWDCSAEGHGHYYSTATSSLNWTWTLVSSTPTPEGTAWAILAAPFTGPPANQFPRVQ